MRTETSLIAGCWLGQLDTFGIGGSGKWIRKAEWAH